MASHEWLEMLMCCRVLVVALLTMATGIAAYHAAAQSLDARIQRGRAIANSICWACHVVAPDQEFSPILRSPGPDFRAIGRRQDATADTLAAFLHSTHRLQGKPYAMPNPRLTDEMIEQVVAYILSLRDRP
jgi:mono/diheme cytochrome c family protein